MEATVVMDTGSGQQVREPRPPRTGTRLLRLAWSRKTGLRAGYCAIVVLLLLSSFEAYRIHSTVAEKNIETYRLYVRQSAAISQVRSAIWLAGNYVRDFFIKPGATGAALLRSQLRELESESRAALDELVQLQGPAQARPELRTRLVEYWKVVDPIPGSDASDEQSGVLCICSAGDCAATERTLQSPARVDGS